MPKGIPLTEEAQAQRRLEIISASAHLFLEQGFSNTTMREIAAAAGVGKSTLYDYFKSKDEILVSYYANEIQKITERGLEINQYGLSITEKLKLVMEMHLAYLRDNENFHMKLSPEIQRLSIGSQKQLEIQRNQYRDLLRSLVEQGIQTGEFRPVNSLFAAHGIYTLLSLAAYTARPTATAEDIMEEAMSIFFTGIQT